MCQSVHLNCTIHMQTILDLLCYFFFFFYCTWWLICTPTSPPLPHPSHPSPPHILPFWLCCDDSLVEGTCSDATAVKCSVNYFLFAGCKRRHRLLWLLLLLLVPAGGAVPSWAMGRLLLFFKTRTKTKQHSSHPALCWRLVTLLELTWEVKHDVVSST